MTPYAVTVALMATLLGLRSRVKADECHEDERYYCVSIKCATGAGYVLLVEWTDLEELNKAPHGKHRGYDVHTEEVLGSDGYLKKHMKVVRLSVGQGVEHIKVQKDSELTLHASWGGYKKLKVTKSGRIDCWGLSGNPKCELK